MRSGADFFQKHYTISRVVSCKASARKLLFSWRYRGKNSKTSKHWWFWLSKIMIFHENLNFPKIISPQTEEIWRWFFSRNFILYHKLIPGKFQLESSSFHGDRVEKPPKKDDFSQFCELEKWWFWWIPKNRISESKMWNPKNVSKVVY